MKNVAEMITDLRSLVCDLRLQLLSSQHDLEATRRERDAAIKMLEHATGDRVEIIIKGRKGRSIFLYPLDD